MNKIHEVSDSICSDGRKKMNKIRLKKCLHRKSDRESFVSVYSLFNLNLQRKRLAPLKSLIVASVSCTKSDIVSMRHIQYNETSV